MLVWAILLPHTFAAPPAAPATKPAAILEASGRNQARCWQMRKNCAGLQSSDPAIVQQGMADVIERVQDPLRNREYFRKNWLPVLVDAKRYDPRALTPTREGPFGLRLPHSGRRDHGRRCGLICC